MLKFQVTNGQGLWRTDKNIVSADTTNLKAQFDLTSDFTGTITVWWRRSDVNNTYTSTLAADGTCTIPAEALAATDKAVYGPYDHDVFVSISDTGRTTTNEYKLTVLRSAFSTNATPGTGGSPTAYEELVEQFDELKADNQTFKDSMTEQQETFESTVTENVDNIRYVVETETAPPIIEEASGAEITLEDSAYRQVRDLKLCGYSKQVQTTGAQLIPFELGKTISSINGNISLTVEENGFYVKGEKEIGDNDVYFLGNTNYQAENGYKKYFSPGEYSCYCQSESCQLIVSAWRQSNAVVLAQVNSSNSPRSFVVEEGDKFRIFIRETSSSIDEVVQAMIYQKGNGAWELYSGGYASPSPDWAQPITSVGDGGSVTVNSAGANIACLPDIESTSIAGVTWQCKDGIVTVNGTAVAISSSRAIGLDYDFAKKRGRFYVSGSRASVNVIVAVSKNEEKSYYINQSFVLDGTETKVTLYMQVSDGVTVSNEIIYPMLNRGNTPLPWQPYIAPSSALIALTDSLRGIPVTSGGNYTDEDGQQWIADYIYRRQTDGKWMLWRNCGEVVYDGSEDEAWLHSSSVSYRFIISGLTSPALSAAIASSFKVSTKATTDVGKFVVNDGSNDRYFNSNQNSLEAWKTWLAENPQTVVYQLFTPTVEELPENVQTELNGLYTYNLHTDMWNNDGAYMSLKYVADTKTWINNKIAGLSTAMIENL